MVCAEINAVEILKYPGRFLSTQTRQPFRIDGVCGGHIRWNYQKGILKANWKEAFYT